MKKEEKKLTFKRFLKINSFELNKDNFRYENGYRYVDYNVVKEAEEKGKLFQLQEYLWKLNERDRMKMLDED